MSQPGGRRSRDRDAYTLKAPLRVGEMTSRRAARSAGGQAPAGPSAASARRGMSTSGVITACGPPFAALRYVVARTMRQGSHGWQGRQQRYGSFDPTPVDRLSIGANGGLAVQHKELWVPCAHKARTRRSHE